MKVLLLDDEPLELEQMEYLIQEKYPLWNLKKVANATQALFEMEQAIKRLQPYQLGFIDIKLPGTTGLEVTERLKALDPSFNVVIVSAFQDFTYAKLSIQLGVVDYLVKPIIEEELNKVLHKFINQHPEYESQSIIIRQVVETVKQSYGERLNLADIAKKLHINASYLSRRFGEELGISFSEYVIHYRIEMAKQILVKQRDWSIQRVAEETGFNSQHYFSTMFKKVTNLSPKEYRNVQG